MIRFLANSPLRAGQVGVLREFPTSLRHLLTLVAVSVSVLLFSQSAGISTLNAQSGERPNVVIIMADDLGIGDISPTNPDCKIPTPSLQQLARQGITFLDAHTPSSVCTPTRYGLLTGRYNWRSRLARGVLNGRSDHLIPEDRPTLGHLMKSAGYKTAMIGKWHLGWDWHKDNNQIDFSQPVKNGPDINGFDRYYAHCGSLDMPPYVWVDTGQVTAAPDREEGVTRKQDPYGWYRKGPIAPDFEIEQVLPHLFSKADQYIVEHASSDDPFFLYLALPAPHTPIVPVPPFRGASKINPYADFVMQVDHHVGELMTTLETADIADQTLVIFTSDNGCSPEANFPVLESHQHDPSAGYRGHKADIYEGGHRVPLIARWPGHIDPDQTSQALACLTDLYRTLEEIVGQTRKPIGGEDSFSLLPAFEGKESTERQSLVSHSIGGFFAIRKDGWKLCLSAGSGGWSAPTEATAQKQELPPLQLFHLESDPSETANLYDQHPDQVDRLLQLLESQIQQGRSTPGPRLENDREISFLPEGFEEADRSSTGPVTTEKLTYKTTSDGAPLEMWLEKPGDWKPEDQRPAIVFFFGGGWVGGDPQQFLPQSRYFAERGMVGIRVRYRVIPRSESGPPTVCCHDAKSAMRFVRAHANELGIDPKRLVASGGSAGGHLAAFSSMVPGIDDPDDDLSVSPTAAAMVLFNPVFDNGPDQGWGHQRVGDRYQEFSPAHNISADDPPAIVFLGDSDPLLNVSVVERFAEKMQRVGVTCKYRVYEGAKHGFFNQEPYRTQTLQTAERFLRDLDILR